MGGLNSLILLQHYFREFQNKYFSNFSHLRLRKEFIATEETLRAPSYLKMSLLTPDQIYFDLFQIVFWAKVNNSRKLI